MTTMTEKHAISAEKPAGVADTPENTKQSLWNVLIYMAADNSLKEECLWALTEILRVGPMDAVDVIAQFDSGSSINRYDFRKLRANANNNGASNRQGQDAPAGTSSSKGSTGGKGSNDSNGIVRIGALAEEVPLKFIPRTNNGNRGDGKIIGQDPAPDAVMIKDFFQSVIGVPAPDPTTPPLPPGSAPEINPFNLLILSGHGSGAVGDFFNTNDPPSALSIPELRSLLESIVESSQDKIDLLGMDSCLMSMVEVCYELRDTVQFMIGAEGFEENTGWPYHNILAALQAEPTMKPKEFACAIVKEYIHYYSDYTVAGVSVDQAACDLSQSDCLKVAVMKLAQTLQDKLKDKHSGADVENAILLAHWRAQSYKFEQYVDLWDFCDLLEKGCGDDDVRDACKETKQAIEKFVLISCFSGAAFQHSHGLSIYFPWAKTDLDKDLPAYKNLAFHKDTRWGDFLETYGNVTQREIRGNSDRSSNKSGKRDQLSMPPRDVEESSVRTNPALGERNLDRRIVRVKNPPDQFYKYADDCAGGCGK